MFREEIQRLAFNAPISVRTSARVWENAHFKSYWLDGVNLDQAKVAVFRSSEKIYDIFDGDDVSFVSSNFPNKDHQFGTEVTKSAHTPDMLNNMDKFMEMSADRLMEVVRDKNKRSIGGETIRELSTRVDLLVAVSDCLRSVLIEVVAGANKK